MSGRGAIHTLPLSSMSRHLARNLYHLMRRAARRTPVDRLQKRGHKTVSVLNFRDVEKLIERAIDGSLRRRGINLDDPSIRDEVRLEFMALLRERDNLSDTVEELLREQETLRENRERLAEQISVVTSEYEEVQAEPVETDTTDFDRLQATMEARLRELLENGSVPADLADQALALVRESIEEQRQLIVTRAQAEHASRLHDLEVRISKLKRKLGETEEMLARARAQSLREAIPGEEVDPGLKFGDPNYETKQELLTEIFKLNVELQDMLKT